MAFEFALEVSRGDETADAIREISSDHETMLDAAYAAIVSGNIGGFIAALAMVGTVVGSVMYGRSLGKAAKD